jgi:hypothetical protein
MVRYLRVTLVMSAIWAALLGVARADTNSVAVLGVEPIDVPEALAQQLTDALRQRAAGTPGIRAVQGKDLIEIKMVFGCDQEQPVCMAQAGRTLGADKLLYGTLRKAGRGGAQVAVSLKLLDVKAGTVEHSVAETVGKKELAAGNVMGTAAKWFAELVPAEAKPILTVTSEPSGATVTVDDKQAGRTPITLRDLSPGAHTVSVSAAGRVTQTRTVELRNGATTDLSISLEAERVTPPVAQKPTPEPTPAHIPTPVQPQPQPAPTASHPGRAAKFVALGALVGAVVAGSVAIYTWRTYAGLEDTTHAELVSIRDANPGATPEQMQFFQAPTCNAPAGLMGVGNYGSDCSRGQTYANTTTALWVITGALAGTAVISYIIGDRQAAKAEKERQKSQARLWQKSLQIAPVFSSKSGGLQASFEF